MKSRDYVFFLSAFLLTIWFQDLVAGPSLPLGQLSHYFRYTPNSGNDSTMDL